MPPQTAPPNHSVQVTVQISVSEETQDIQLNTVRAQAADGNQNVIELSEEEQRDTAKGACLGVEALVNSTCVPATMLADRAANLPLAKVVQFKHEVNSYRLVGSTVTTVDVLPVDFSQRDALSMPTWVSVELFGITNIASAKHVERSYTPLGRTSGEMSMAASALGAFLAQLEIMGDSNATISSQTTQIKLDLQPLHCVAGAAEAPRGSVDISISFQDLLSTVARIAVAHTVADVRAVVQARTDFAQANPQVPEALSEVDPQEAPSQMVQASLHTIAGHTKALYNYLRAQPSHLQSVYAWAQNLLMHCYVESAIVNMEHQMYVNINAMASHLHSLKLQNADAKTMAQMRSVADNFVNIRTSHDDMTALPAFRTDHELKKEVEKGQILVPAVPALQRMPSAGSVNTVALGTQVPFCARTADNLRGETALAMLEDACKLYSVVACHDTDFTVADAFKAVEVTRGLITRCHDALLQSVEGRGAHPHKITSNDLYGETPLDPSLFKEITGEEPLYSLHYIELCQIAQLVFTTYSRAAKYKSDETPVTEKTGQYYDMLRSMYEKNDESKESFPRVALATVEYMLPCSPDIQARAMFHGKHTNEGPVARDDCESLTTLVEMAWKSMRYVHSNSRDGKLYVAKPAYTSMAHADDKTRALDAMRFLAALFPIGTSLTSVNGAKLADSQGEEEFDTGLHLLTLMTSVGALGEHLQAGEALQPVFKELYSGSNRDTYYSHAATRVLKSRIEQAVRVFEKCARARHPDATVGVIEVEATGPSSFAPDIFTVEQAKDPQTFAQITKDIVGQDATGNRLLQELKAKHGAVQPVLPATSTAFSTMAVKRAEDYADKLLTKFSRAFQELYLKEPLIDGVDPADLYYMGTDAIKLGADPTTITGTFVMPSLYCAAAPVDSVNDDKFGWAAGVVAGGSRHKFAEKLKLLAGQRVNLPQWRRYTNMKECSTPVTDVRQHSRVFSTSSVKTAMFNTLENIGSVTIPRLPDHYVRRTMVVTRWQIDARSESLVAAELAQYAKHGAIISKPFALPAATFNGHAGAMAIFVDLPKRLLQNQDTMSSMLQAVKSLADSTRGGAVTFALSPQTNTTLKSAATNGTERVQSLAHQKCVYVEELLKLQSANSKPLNLVAPVKKEPTTVSSVGSAIRNILTTGSSQPLKKTANTQDQPIAVPLTPQPEPEPELQPELDVQTAVAENLAVTPVADEPLPAVANEPSTAEPVKLSAQKSSRAGSSRHRMRSLRKTLQEQSKLEPVADTIVLKETVGATAIVENETFTTTQELVELVTLAMSTPHLSCSDARHQLALSEIEVECMIDGAVMQTVHGTRTLTQDVFAKNMQMEGKIVLTDSALQALQQGRAKVFVNL